GAGLGDKKGWLHDSRTPRHGGTASASGRWRHCCSSAVAAAAPATLATDGRCTHGSPAGSARRSLGPRARGAPGRASEVVRLHPQTPAAVLPLATAAGVGASGE